MNTEGGTIYVGIANNGEVIGIKGDIDEAQRKISDIFTEQISPRCVEFVSSHKVILEGKEVIQIDVSKGTMLYHIKKYGHSEAGCFIRIGTTCKSMTPDEITRRFLMSVPEKDITDIPSRFDDLTFQILKNYLTSHGYHYSDDTFDKNLHLRMPDGRYNYMAELLADHNDILLMSQHLPRKIRPNILEEMNLAASVYF